MQTFVLVIGLALFASALIALGVVVRQRQIERDRIARYAGSGRNQPKSIVCPKCARRSYSETAIRDRYCPSCKEYHANLIRA